MLLEFLRGHITQEALGCRLRWEPGTLAMWVRCMLTLLLGLATASAASVLGDCIRFAHPVGIHLGMPVLLSRLRLSYGLEVKG